MEHKQNRTIDFPGEIFRIIRKIIRSLNLESKRINKEHGITIPQLICLEHLSYCPDYQSSHRELTRILNLNSSTVTGIIDRLEKKGLVARLPKKVDKRVTYIALTARGARLLDKTPQLMQHKLSSHLRKMDEREIITLKENLQKLSAMLDIDEIEASPMLTVDEPIDKHYKTKTPKKLPN